MHTANPEAELETFLPVPVPQADLDPHSEDFQAILVLRLKLVQLRQRILKHPEFCVTFRGTDFLFEGHS